MDNYWCILWAWKAFKMDSFSLILCQAYTKGQSRGLNDSIGKDTMIHFYVQTVYDIHNFKRKASQRCQLPMVPVPHIQMITWKQRGWLATVCAVGGYPHSGGASCKLFISSLYSAAQFWRRGRAESPYLIKTWEVMRNWQLGVSQGWSEGKWELVLG